MPADAAFVGPRSGSVASWPPEQNVMEAQPTAPPHPPSSRWLIGQQGSQTHVVHLPTPLLADLEQHAQRLGKQVSWCLRMAWNLASPQLSDPHALRSVALDPLLEGPKQVHTVSLPVAAWLQVALEAERLDRSRSWLLQRVWLLARPRIVNA